MSSVKCIIPGVNLKGFGRAIQSLSKIGDELYFEPLESGLYLRSVNSSRSAYGSFQFTPSFFSHYAVGGTDNDEHSDYDVPRCKLGMKSVMSVFKSMSTIDKMAEKCSIYLDSSESRLIFQMYCRHGIVKTHKLAIVECETLQAVFSKDMCPNKLTAAPKLLCDAVLNFQNNQEEITLIIRPHYMALKNYVDDEPDPNKVIHTEVTLSPEEFEQYQAGVDTDITFCLRELRAVLAFADVMNLPLAIHFESAGRPITFSITSDLSFEANFVLATLADVESLEKSAETAQSREHALKKTGTNKRNVSSSNNRNHESHKNSTNLCSQPTKPQSHELSYKDKPGPSRDITTELSMMCDVTAPDESYISQQCPLASVSNTNISHLLNNTDECVQRNTFHNDNSEENMDVTTTERHINPKSAIKFNALMNRNNEKGYINGGQQQEVHSEADDNNGGSGDRSQNSKRKFLSLKTSTSGDNETTSPVIPLQDKHLQTNSSDDNDDDDDEIPVTPPSKKFRSVFFGTQSSTQSTQSQQKSVILAPDSDDDN